MTNPEDAFDDAPTNVLRKYDIYYGLPSEIKATGRSAPSAADAAQAWLEEAKLVPSALPDEIYVVETGADLLSSVTFKVVPQVRAVPIEDAPVE